MARKTLISSAIAIIILCLFSGFVFAEDNNQTSVNLGNEIMKSVDKTGDSMNNVISGNAIKDTGNMVKDGMDNMVNGVSGAINDTERRVGNETNNMMNGTNGMISSDRDYNVVRTDVQGTTGDVSTMTTTTWMWIILVVAAVVIIAAIWYYATQNNS